LSVRVTISHSTLLRLNDTHTCNEQFEKKCCKAGATGFGARICTASSPADCAKVGDGKQVFNADVKVDSPTSILITVPLASAMATHSEEVVAAAAAPAAGVAHACGRSWLQPQHARTASTAATRMPSPAAHVLLRRHCRNLQQLMPPAGRRQRMRQQYLAR